MPSTPRRTVRDVSAIPRELKVLRQWVCWRDEPRKGKITKVPIAPQTGGRASVRDPETWDSFENALAAYERNRQLAGVGFVLTADDPYVGIDLDAVRSSDGRWDETALKFISTLNSYAEVSPSGLGLRIVARGTLPARDRRAGNVEMYADGRFLTITGDVVNGANREVNDCSASLLTLHSKYLSRQNADAPEVDAAIVAKAMVRFGDRFNRLYQLGDDSGYPSRSEADLALCGFLARVEADAARIDSIFRTSAMMRSKWNETRGTSTYGLATIERALASFSRGRNAIKVEGEAQILTFAQLKARAEKSVSWLVDGLIPEAGIMLLSGLPKVCKSSLARTLAKAVATGSQFLGRNCSRGAVLWIGLEEPVPHVIEQAERMGLDNLDIVWMLQRPHGDRYKFLRDAIKKANPKLIIVDTIARFAEIDDINHYSEVNRGLQPFLDLRREFGVAFVLLHHNNRANRPLGSVGIDGAVDTLMTVTRAPDGRRYFSTIQRAGCDIPETLLVRDDATGLITCSEHKESADQRHAERRIEELARDGMFATRETFIRQAGRSGKSARAAFDALVASGVLTAAGSGRKNDPRLYRLSEAKNQE